VAHGDVVHVHSALGASELHEVPRFPPLAAAEARGGCRAPMPGKILHVHVSPGARVRRGDTLVVLEAMKMEHTVAAPHDGTVREVPVEPGQQVEAGEVLVVLEEEAPA
jgi:propionyl-CoA carboxylase alpha chain